MARTTSPDDRLRTAAGDPDRQAAKEPAFVLAGSYGHPIHPMLVTLPIGMWVASFVFDILSRNAEDEAVFANGAYWLIGVGILGAASAAVFGLVDLSRIAKGTRAWRTGILHLGLNGAVLVLFAVSWLLRRSRDGFPATSNGLLLLSIVALSAMMASGALGGTLAYRFGVRVVDEDSQSEGFEHLGHH